MWVIISEIYTCMHIQPRRQAGVQGLPDYYRQKVNSVDHIYEITIICCCNLTKWHFTEATGWLAGISESVETNRSRSGSKHSACVCLWTSPIKQFYWYGLKTKQFFIVQISFILFAVYWVTSLSRRLRSFTRKSTGWVNNVSVSLNCPKNLCALPELCSFNTPPWSIEAVL